MGIVQRESMDISKHVRLAEAPFQLDVIHKGTIRFSEVEGLEERFPPGYETMVYVPHLVHCGDLVIRNGAFVRTPNMMEWLDKYNLFRAERVQLLVKLLDEEGEDFYVWRFFNARPRVIDFEEHTLNEHVVRIKFLAIEHDGMIREL